MGCSSNLCPYEDHPFPHRYFDGTVYLNLSSDPFAFLESEWDRIVLELQATQPEVLEGEPVYLSLLAEVFPAPQVDLYGSTEAGYIFVGEAFRDNSQVIDDNAFVELTPWRGLKDVFQISVTTRGREAMPLLRYRTGDIVQKFPTGFRLLGRESNLYFRQDGSMVSPTDVDAALPENFACWHYLLVQTSESRWDFHYVTDHIDHAVPREVEGRLSTLLGEGVRVNAFRRKVIAPAASGKFALLKPLGK